ncbi:trypsin-like cysteine/serine peptidase domain-containing protein [Nemania sp. FL0031]|nr:trypsin-like cysteine/serine peptidase domain-containing protein [Nemania sp. FL0031]
MDPLHVTRNVIVEQSAILQILDISADVVARDAEETEDVEQLAHDLRNRYRDYQRLQQNLDDLKKLFSSDEYEELRLHVQGVEESFWELTQFIQLVDIKAKWLLNFLHLTEGRQTEDQLEKSYANAVEAMHTLNFSVTSDQGATFVNETLKVIETFSSNLVKFGSKFDSFEPLTVRVRIVNYARVNKCLNSISRDLKAIARIMKTQQLYPQPSFENETHAVAWELSLDDTPDRAAISVQRNNEYSRLLEPMRQFELLVEVRPQRNSQYKQVPAEDFNPSGKYRGVCKLLMKCCVEKRPDMVVSCEASGWLIDDKTVVTCGHCVYSTKTSPRDNEDYGILRAKEIEVYIGYHREATVGSSDVEMRKGKWALTHRQWYDRWEKDCDIAMIRLEKAFDNPGTLPYVDVTPRRGKDEMTYVVGYPEDIPPNGRHNILEDSKGGVMYESSRATTWDLDNMSTGLQYRTDTSAGNSGGPILRYNSENILEVIGVHAAGEATTGINSATILGRYGNHLPTFLAALNAEKGGVFPNGRFCDDKVVGWPKVQVLNLPYVAR